MRRQRSGVKTVRMGDLPIGGENPISVQSMTNTKTENIEATLHQIEKLKNAGCELVRAAVPGNEAAEALFTLTDRVNIPLVADIHFDYRLALKAVEAGVDGLRLNPGNIGGKNKVKEVIEACKDHNLPVRIGINSGSLEKDLAEKHGGPTPKAMVESAERHISYLEEENFYDIVVSLKSSSVNDTIEANCIFAYRYDYPLHIGITEAGSGREGEIKSAAGIGALLSRNLGDTLRVSLTGSPLREVEVAYQILSAFDERQRGVEVISCPTCGRTDINVEEIVKKVKEGLKEFQVHSNLTVAVMGCEVNGPEEARHADIGVAGGRNSGLIFKKGEKLRKAAGENLAETLLQEIKQMECD